MIPISDVPRYRNPKGFVSQNVLPACNFDLEFMYVLSNALTRHSSRLIVSKGMYLSCRNKLYMCTFVYWFTKWISGKFYPVDYGFANRQTILAPFRRTRYPLQEFRGEGCDPKKQAVQFAVCIFEKRDWANFWYYQISFFYLQVIASFFVYNTSKIGFSLCRVT